MTSGGRYDREVQLGKEQTAEAMALIGSEPVAEKQGAQLFQPPPILKANTPPQLPTTPLSSPEL